MGCCRYNQSLALWGIRRAGDQAYVRLRLFIATKNTKSHKNFQPQNTQIYAEKTKNFSHILRILWFKNGFIQVSPSGYQAPCAGGRAYVRLRLFIATKNTKSHKNFQPQNTQIYAEKQKTFRQSPRFERQRKSRGIFCVFCGLKMDYSSLPLGVSGTLRRGRAYVRLRVSGFGFQVSGFESLPRGIRSALRRGSELV